MKSPKKQCVVRTKIALLFPLTLLLLTVTSSDQSSQSYRLFTSVLDEAAGSPNSTNYRIEASSAGQPTPVGVSQSTNYQVYGGYLYTLEITCADPPQIVASALDNGNQGCPYSEQLEVQPGTGTHPLQWTVTEGELPLGLTLNSAHGEISGSPATTGTFDFIVGVTDFCGETDTQAFSITINPYERVKSDANCDCFVDILDVLFVVNIILVEVEPTEDQEWCADCNGPPGNCDGDGEVNIIDALKIVNLILGEDTCP